MRRGDGRWLGRSFWPHTGCQLHEMRLSDKAPAYKRTTGCGNLFSTTARRAAHRKRRQSVDKEEWSQNKPFLTVSWRSASMERTCRPRRPRPQSHQRGEVLIRPRPQSYPTNENPFIGWADLERELSRKEQMEEGWDADAVDALRGYAPLSHDATTAEKLEWKHLNHESNQELLECSNNDFSDDEDSWDLIDGQGPKPAGPPPIPGTIDAHQSPFLTASTRASETMTTQPSPRHMLRDSDASRPEVAVQHGLKRRAVTEYVPIYETTPEVKDSLRYRQQFKSPDYFRPPPGYVGPGFAQEDVLSSASESRPRKRLAKQRRPNLPHATPSGMDLAHAKKDEDILQDTLSELKALKMENERLRQNACQAPVSSQPACSYKVFYQIREALYLDEPCWEPSEGSSVILLANNPIRRLEHYLDQHPEIVFAIYKDYKQDLLSDSREIETVDGIYRSPTPTHEVLSFVSPDMRSAVKELVQQIPRFDYYFPHFKLDRDIPAPYLFMYYSTPFIAGVLPKLSTRSRNLIEKLQAVVAESYGHEYTSVKLQAEKGTIARKYLKYLVRPGDVLVSNATEGNIPQACIARSWIETPDTTLKDPDLEEWDHVEKRFLEGHDSLVNSISSRKMTTYVWKVPVWYWLFDGNFGRHETSIDIMMSLANEGDSVEIRSLNNYPLQYATAETRSFLEKRGKIFWSLRNRRFVSYMRSEEDELYNVCPQQEGAIKLLQQLTHKL